MGEGVALPSPHCHRLLSERAREKLWGCPSITRTISALQVVRSDVNHEERSALSGKVGPQLIFYTCLWCGIMVLGAHLLSISPNVRHSGSIVTPCNSCLAETST